MKILALTFLMSLSITAFADNCSEGVGQDCSKSPEICEDVDKCPSQTCANSCLNVNKNQMRESIKTGTSYSGKNGGSSAQSADGTPIP